MALNCEDPTRFGTVKMSEHTFIFPCCIDSKRLTRVNTWLSWILFIEFYFYSFFNSSKPSCWVTISTALFELWHRGDFRPLNVIKIKKSSCIHIHNFFLRTYGGNNRQAVPHDFFHPLPWSHQISADPCDSSPGAEQSMRQLWNFFSPLFFLLWERQFSDCCYENEGRTCL